MIYLFALCLWNMLRCKSAFWVEPICGRIQTDPVKREHWADSSFMKANKENCRDLQMGGSVQKRNQLTRSPAEKDVRVAVGSRFTVCNCASSILGCTRRIMASKLGEIIIPLSLILLRPYLDYCVQSGAPRLREIEKLEIALQRTTKVIRGLKHVAWKGRFGELGWFGLEKRSLRRN